MKLWLFVAMSLCAFGQIERPRIGMMLDRNGDARPVLGVAGSATLGDPVLSGVVSLSCAAQVCLAKTETSLLSSTGESMDAPAGPAIFAAPYIYFPAARQLVQWHQGQLDPIEFTPEGEVLSLRRNGDGLDYAVRRDDEVWIEHYSLTDQSRVLLGSLGPGHTALLIDAGVVVATRDQVRLVRADGTEATFDIARVQGFVAMSDSSIELVTLQNRWILSLNAASVHLLPGVSE